MAGMYNLAVISEPKIFISNIYNDSIFHFLISISIGYALGNLKLKAWNYLMKLEQ